MKIQFYLNEILTDALISKGKEGDSPHLIAKGLIEEILKGDRQPTPTLPPDLEDRLSDLEHELQDKNQGFTPDDLERLGKLMVEDIKKDLGIPDNIGDRLDNLEGQMNESLEISHAITKGTEAELEQLRFRLNNLEKQIAAMPPDLDRRLKIVDDLINQIANFDPAPKPETAIMIQKQPLPPTDLPSTPAEITLTHEEAAHEFERAARTVKSWANDPNKWPQGWIWDGDRQFWIKTV